MRAYVGIDTSNYTTSAALYFPQTGELRQQKQLLPVPEGGHGLRQSDAVFHHTRQLPDVIEALWADFDGTVEAIGVSRCPTQAAGSYMPCFLAGWGAARQLAAALRVKAYTFTHQQGHVAAALYGCGHTEWLGRELLAFHVSGGTTEALHVKPTGDRSIACVRVAGSLDLKAGQLIDRVGSRLGLAFPAGPALEQLALTATDCPRARPVLRGADCSLSGVENQCDALIAQGAAPAVVALFCLRSVQAALEGMTSALRVPYPSVPLLYAGGVMANSLLRSALSQRFGGVFAPPDLSADNAAGLAVLAAWAAGEPLVEEVSG